MNFGKSFRSVVMLLAVLITFQGGLAVEPPDVRSGPASIDRGATEAAEAGVAAISLADFAGQTVVSSSATSLDVWLESKNGPGTVVVRPGAEVEYRILGLLSDDANEGLALVGLSLTFEGGDLEQADEPTGDPESGCENPMVRFAKPWGITNPAGFGGTIINGELVQIGGAQNTINNTPENAEFPVGSVLAGVAQPGGCGAVVLVTGRLTAPPVEGTYLLQIFDVFANVIQEGETGEDFWRTQTAFIGDVGNLHVVVDDRKPIRVISPKAQPRPGRLPD